MDLGCIEAFYRLPRISEECALGKRSLGCMRIGSCQVFLMESEISWTPKAAGGGTPKDERRPQSDVAR